MKGVVMLVLFLAFIGAGLTFCVWLLLGALAFAKKALMTTIFFGVEMALLVW